MYYFFQIGKVADTYKRRTSQTQWCNVCLIDLDRSVAWDIYTREQNFTHPTSKVQL